MRIRSKRIPSRASRASQSQANQNSRRGKSRQVGSQLRAHKRHIAHRARDHVRDHVRAHSPILLRGGDGCVNLRDAILTASTTHVNAMKKDNEQNQGVFDDIKNKGLANIRAESLRKFQLIQKKFVAAKATYDVAHKTYRAAKATYDAATAAAKTAYDAAIAAAKTAFVPVEQSYVVPKYNFDTLEQEHRAANKMNALVQNKNFAELITTTRAIAESTEKWFQRIATLAGQNNIEEAVKQIQKDRDRFRRFTVANAEKRLADCVAALRKAEEPILEPFQHAVNIPEETLRSLRQSVLEQAPELNPFKYAVEYAAEELKHVQKIARWFDSIPTNETEMPPKSYIQIKDLKGHSVGVFVCLPCTAQDLLNHPKIKEAIPNPTKVVVRGERVAWIDNSVLNDAFIHVL
jgi:hypothetical protein